jgi:hypothetical protein
MAEGGLEKMCKEHATYYANGGFESEKTKKKINVAEKYPESSRPALAPGIVDSAQKDLVYQG